MNKGLKIFVILCAGLIVVGLILAGIGILLGGTPILPLEGRFWHWGGTEEYKAAYSGKTVEDTAQPGAFSSVAIRVGVADISFIASDDYRVEYSYDKGFGKTNVEVRNDTLYVEDKIWAKRLSPRISGWNFPEDSQRLYVRVYYPAGQEFNKIELVCNLGSAELREIKGGELTAELNLGNLSLKNVTVESADLNLDLGNIEAKGFNSGGLTANLDLGNAELEGVFTGVTQIDCDLGDIELQTALAREEYSFDIDVDLGSLTLNGRELGTPYEAGSGTNSLRLTCDMGSVEVECR